MIHCILCIETLQSPFTITDAYEAVTVSEGYAVCEQHLLHVISSNASYFILDQAKRDAEREAS